MMSCLSALHCMDIILRKCNAQQASHQLIIMLQNAVQCVQYAGQKPSGPGEGTFMRRMPIGLNFAASLAPAALEKSLRV